jgi:hypothetical protein
MPEPSTEPTSPHVPHEGPLSPVQVRWLMTAIVVMGILIVLGIVGVIARIFYLSSTPPPAPLRDALPKGVVTHARLQLPSGAVVRSLALDGDRLALYYEAPAGSGVAIVSVASGRVLSRWSLEPEPPR